LERIEMTSREACLTFKSDAEPRTVTLDPNHWVLMKQEFGEMMQ
jgi:hypothetical protein